MSAPNYEELLSALRDVGEFAKRVGAKKEANSFQTMQTRLQEDKRVSKDLQEEIFKARGLAAFWIPSHISKQRWDDSKKGLLKQEFSALNQALVEALIPTKPAAFPESEVQGLAGNDEYTKVLGEPKDSAKIAKRAMDVVGRFSSAIFKQDLETAYGLCANEMRTWMSLKRFWTELEKADKKFGGKAVEYKIERVGLIWADAISRAKTSNKDGAWPKDTPKSNKRATVGTFWFTNPSERRGRWAAFWVTEEEGGYRIAKFEQYLQ